MNTVFVRSYIRAPTHCPVNTVQPCVRDSMVEKMRPSIFSAAAFPETAREPREFTQVCRGISDAASIAACSPAGIPIRRMRRIFSLRRQSLRRSSRQSASSRMRARRARKAERYWVITVATATPITSQWKMATKRILRIRLVAPEIARKISGCRESPLARIRDAPVL